MFCWYRPVFFLYYGGTDEISLVLSVLGLVSRENLVENWQKSWGLALRDGSRWLLHWDEYQPVGEREIKRGLGWWTSQPPLVLGQHSKRVLSSVPQLRLPRPRSSPSLAGPGGAELAVPGVGYGGPLDLGTGEVDPDLTGAALDHRPTSVGLAAVAGDLLVLLLKLV